MAMQALDPAAMQTGHMGNDRQSEAAVALLAARGIKPMKRLKGLLPLLRWHAIPLIPDLDAAASIFDMQAQNDRSNSVRESIVDQVGDGTTESNRFDRN